MDGRRWRVGRSVIFSKRDRDYHRLGPQLRATQEQADVWALRLFSTEGEASRYEEFIATNYGISEWPFIGNKDPKRHPRGSMPQEHLDAFYVMLDEQQQRERGHQCLCDHGLLPDYPLVSHYGEQSPTRGLKTAAANLLPEIMMVPVPLRHITRADWLPITELGEEHYEGPVHSLDVATHHNFIQDGVLTCNSVVGIGPVLAAGLVANFDPIPPPTAGHWWSFAGINPDMQWKPGEKRPFSAMLKVLQWKISGSFVKFSSHEHDVYGKHYRREKQRYITNNDRGAYVERAKADAKRVDRKTDAWKWYAGCYPAGTTAAWEAEGKGLSAEARQRAQKKLLEERRGVAGDGLPMLPPGHVDNRARRWVAKLFISHYHHVCFGIHFGEDPPKPYVISHLHHAHAIDPPDWRKYV